MIVVSPPPSYRVGRSSSLMVCGAPDIDQSLAECAPAFSRTERSQHPPLSYNTDDLAPHPEQSRKISFSLCWVHFALNSTVISFPLVSFYICLFYIYTT